MSELKLNSVAFVAEAGSLLIPMGEDTNTSVFMTVDEYPLILQYFANSAAASSVRVETVNPYTGQSQPFIDPNTAQAVVLSPQRSVYPLNVPGAYQLRQVSGSDGDCDVYYFASKMPVMVRGMAGGAGAQGDAGTQGPRGSQGSQGSQGSVGAQGLNGFGLQGVAGPQGSQGSVGAQGQGNQGAQGSQGTAGAQGSQGSQGTAGIDAPIAPIIAAYRFESSLAPTYGTVLLDDPAGPPVYSPNGFDGEALVTENNTGLYAQTSAINLFDYPEFTIQMKVFVPTIPAGYSTPILHFGTTVSSLQFRVYVNPNDATQYTFTLTYNGYEIGRSMFAHNVWVDAVIMRDSSNNLHLYIDGLPSGATIPGPVGSPVSLQPLRLGVGNYTNNVPAPVRIDNLILRNGRLYTTYFEPPVDWAHMINKDLGPNGIVEGTGVYAYAGYQNIPVYLPDAPASTRTNALVRPNALLTLNDPSVIAGSGIALTPGKKYRVTANLWLKSDNNDLQNVKMFLKEFNNVNLQLGVYYAGDVRHVTVGGFNLVNLTLSVLITDSSFPEMGIMVEYQGTGVSVPAYASPVYRAAYTLEVQEI